MIDEKLSLRQDHYRSKYNIKENFIFNDEYKLSLRKTKLFTSLMQKRSEDKHIKSRPLTFNDILLEPQLRNQIILLQDFLYNSHSTNLTEEQDEYLLNTLIPQLSDYLFSKLADILIKENIVLIFIDLFDSFASSFIDVVFLIQLEQEISLSLKKNHLKFHTLLLVFLSNLLSEDEEDHKIITNTVNVSTIIQSAYASFKDNIDDEAKRVLFVLITNFLSFYDTDNTEKLIAIAQSVLIPEILLAQRQMNSQLLLQAIRSLNCFANCDALIDCLLSNKELLSLLTEILTTRTDQSAVIMLFSALSAKKRALVGEIINDKVINCFIENIICYSIKLNSELSSYDDKKLLYKEEGQAFIYSIRALSNVLCNENNHSKTEAILHKEPSVIQSLLNSFKAFTNESIQREIIHFLIKGLNSFNPTVNEAFINGYAIHKAFYAILVDIALVNYFDNEIIITEILNLLDSVLVCLNNTNYYFNVKAQLQQLDFVESLAKIQLKSNSDVISTKIEALLSIHWNENEIYYNACSDYMNVR